MQYVSVTVPHNKALVVIVAFVSSYPWEVNIRSCSKEVFTNRAEP